MSLPDIRHTLVEGRKLAWREAGQGPPLLFIHGMAGDSQNWETQYAKFMDRHRVIGWDAPGYGGSDDWPTDAPSVCDYTDVIMKLLDALEINKAHMVGHSFGGTLVPAFQKSHPDRVLSLVMAQPVIGSGPLGPEKQAEIITAREQLLADLGVAGYARDHAPKSCAATADAATIEKGVKVTSRTRPIGYLAQWRAMARADIMREISEEPGPATVVAGAGDKTASLAVVRRIANAVKGAELVELRDVGHMIYIEHPERFNAALKVHLTRVR
ncbi:MAG: alpha/beta hydrolase [Pseudomonadota bacterium]|nr:alpha/beta hydrolase [Pseudomonadota bacterium]